MTTIKKIIIPKNDLPPVNSDTEKYVVRYRIVSEDQNRASHWSPQYLLAPKPLTVEEQKNIEISPSSNVIFVTWEPEIQFVSQPDYDIWVAWGTTGPGVGLFDYYATVSSNFAVIPISVVGATLVQVIIQTASYPRKRIDKLIVADSGVVSIV